MGTLVAGLDVNQVNWLCRSSGSFTSLFKQIIKINDINLHAQSEMIVLDACILMSGVLRPLLLNLAQAGLFHPVWSSYIGLEWRRNAARLWPINRDLLSDEWAQMQQRFPQACFDPSMVDAHFETLSKPLLRRSDAKDHHVIMAGVRALSEHDTKEFASVNAVKVSQQSISVAHEVKALKKVSTNILTWNIRDFNRTELRQLNLGLFNPDQLLCSWWVKHRALITHHLERVVQTLIHDGRREPAPIADFLHRERLFRFKQLYCQHT